MTGSAPWHKRYHSDALTGYRGLNLEQRGAYSTILDLLYDSGDDALPASERWMAGQLDVSPRKWRTLRDELVAAGKLQILPDGRITNARYLRERAKAMVISEKRADAGRKGGQATPPQGALDLKNEAENKPNSAELSRFSTPENELSGKDNSDEQPEKALHINGDAKANASDLPLRPHVRARLDARDQIEVEDSHSSRFPNPARESNLLLREPDWDHVELSAHFMRLAGVSDIQPGTIIASQKLVRSWLDSRIALDMIEAIIVQRRDAATSPIRSLSYFDAAIRQAHSKTEHPRNGKPATSLDDIRDPVFRRYLTDRSQTRVDP